MWTRRVGLGTCNVRCGMQGVIWHASVIILVIPCVPSSVVPSHPSSHPSSVHFCFPHGPFTHRINGRYSRSRAVQSIHTTSHKHTNAKAHHTNHSDERDMDSASAMELAGRMRLPVIRPVCCALCCTKHSPACCAADTGCSCAACAKLHRQACSESRSSAGGCPRRRCWLSRCRHCWCRRFSPRPPVAWC